MRWGLFEMPVKKAVCVCTRSSEMHILKQEHLQSDPSKLYIRRGNSFGQCNSFSSPLSGKVVVDSNLFLQQAGEYYFLLYWQQIGLHFLSPTGLL